ncbi:hypothetical protein ACFLQN_02770 [Candidatus Aenigmatarchaeota archaeon]
MKGLEISTNMMVLVILVVIVLSVIAYFVSSQGSTQSERAEANRVFAEQCNIYKEGGCTWSVTRTSKFIDFAESCQVLFGNQNKAYSCLYKFCCELSQDKVCEGLCSVCKANSRIRMTTTLVNDCLDDYYSQCDNTCAVVSFSG